MPDLVDIAEDRPIAANAAPNDATNELPFETSELRRLLDAFLDRRVVNPITGNQVKLGAYTWGVYSFFDYDNEPIYVGQTKEKLGGRIRRHLTNQRTDAVAMNVLDPFEVYKIIVYPLPELEGKSGRDVEAMRILNDLEYRVHEAATRASRFQAILNEKDPFSPTSPTVTIPEAHEGIIVSEAVKRLREHPDIRIARRSQVISRLAQVISERKVKKGLRRVLHVQAQRLEWLASRRLENAAEVDEED